MSKTTSPGFLTLIAKHNDLHGINLTFSEMNKTARRLERHYADRPASEALVTADEYLRIHWSDPTAETAMAHLENPAECDHHDNVARRLSLVAS